MKIKIKLLAGFFTIIIFIILLGVVSFLDATDMGKHFEFLVVHDLEVLKNAEELQKFVVDAETGQRGFVITGEEEFLEPYYSGIEGFDSLLIIEMELVSDNPSQVQRLEKISNLFEDWKTKAAIPEIELGQKIADNRYSVADLDEILSAGVGKGILDELRMYIDILVVEGIDEGNTEQQLLLSHILADLVDRETGQRGFLITGEEEFLEPYHSGNEKLEEHFIELKLQLEVEGEPENIDAMNRIIHLSDEWLEKAGLPEIEARYVINENPETLADMADLLKIGTGKNILDEMREEFATFIQIEVGLKDQRFEQALVVENNTKIAVIVILIISVIVAVSIALYAARVIAKPIEILTKATNEVAQGNLKAKIKQFDTHDEIGQLSKSFNIMTKSLKDSTEKLTNALKELKKVDLLKEEFSTMITHELRTPLSTIIGYGEMLKDPKMGELNKEQENAIDEIRTSSASLENLIGNILTAQKIDLLRLTFNIQKTSVKELLKQAYNRLLPLMSEKQIDFLTSIEDNIIITVDKERMMQIISNLVQNSVDFVPASGGRIEITCSNKNSDVLFSVIDNGSGIPKDKLKNLFTKYYQIDTSIARKHEGSGLGLVICKGIIEGFGGKIWIESEEGKETIIYFTIPKKSSTK